MSLGGPGSLGPVTMKDGGGPVPGLPPRPPRTHGPLRWFGLGLTTGVVGTLLAVLVIMTLTR